MNEKKIAFVTGSTDGIGLFTATKLSQKGYKVIIHGRNQERITQALQKIRSEVPEADLDYIVCDLQSIEATKRMCDEILQRYTKLDLLLNNAGVLNETREESIDGNEMTLAVNVLAAFVITSKLFELVRNTPHSRIIEVGSISQPRYLDLTKIQHKEHYNMYEAYNYSKLMMICIALELAERYPDVWINTLDPGDVNTKMLIKGWGRCGIEIEEADNEFWLATNPDIESIHGKYFINKRISKAKPQAYDSSFRKQLFTILEQLTHVSFPSS